MIQKIKKFYHKYRTTILRINDFILGTLIWLQPILPSGKLREFLGGLLAILYSTSTARYYLPKK